MPKQYIPGQVLRRIRNCPIKLVHLVLLPVFQSYKMINSGGKTSLLLIILCGTCCVLIFHNTKSKFVITIASDPPIYELSRIIHQQSMRIEYLSKNPKIIFRCLDDEPTIKYPRHANENLTEIIMDTSDECGNTTSTDAVLIVHTAANHFQRRELFRRLYHNYNNTKPFRLKVVFLIGSTLDANLHIKLEKENIDYGDTVVGSFLDTYQNLTLKAVMGFRWVMSTCADAKLIIKMDDDVVFDVKKFFFQYWLKIDSDRKNNSLHCLVWNNAHVGRTGKWKVERGLFANASYPFPYCAGFFVVVTPDLIKSIYAYGKSIDFFWIDDVFLYGMVPAAIKGVNFIQLWGKPLLLAKSYAELKQCRQRNGRDKCHIWASLVDRETDFYREYLTLLSDEEANHNNITSEISKKDIH